MQIAYAGPIGDGAGEVVVAQVEGGYPPKGARRPVPVDVARVNAPHTSPPALKAARVRPSIRVPSVVVEPVGPVEEPVQVDQRRLVRPTRKAGHERRTHQEGEQQPLPTTHHFFFPRGSTNRTSRAVTDKLGTHGCCAMSNGHVGTLPPARASLRFYYRGPQCHASSLTHCDRAPARTNQAHMAQAP